MDRAFNPGQRILEINCGTGIDAAHLALRGIEVLACDSAPGMIAVAQRRADSFFEALPVRFRCLRTEAIDEVAVDGPFDGVLSNFSGLNCLQDLEAVAENLAWLVRPGGRAVLCVFGTFCVSEVIWYLCRRNAHKAFRRFRHRGVPSALTSNSTIAVHYHSLRAIRRSFIPYFRLTRQRGVGVAIPPTFASPLVERFPGLFRVAVAIDPIVGRCPVVRSIADHRVLTFERTGEAIS